MTYALWYNGYEININDNNTMNETFYYNLTNLEVFTEYTITILACTSDCSVKSDSLTQKTAMGEPSVIMQPKLENIDDNKVFLKWEAPKLPGGNLDYYQLKLISSHENDLVEENVYRLQGSSVACVLKGLPCQKDQVAFAVRGVNVQSGKAENSFMNSEMLPNCLSFPETKTSKNDSQYYGEWSPPVTLFCPNHLSIVTILAALVVFPLWLLSIYIFWRIYQKYKKMKDIHIVWPRDLDPELPSPHSSSFRQDVDLLKNCPLMNLKEEEEVIEEDIFLPKPINRHEFMDSKIPLKVDANDLSLTLLRMSSIRMIKSEPATPNSSRSNGLQIDLNPGYTEMHPPRKSQTEVNSPISGYMDMSGKSPVPSPIVEIPEQIRETTENDYIVQKFIKNSELNNNGYIGKRASIAVNPMKKCQPIVLNSNGYIGVVRK